MSLPTPPCGRRLRALAAIVLLGACASEPPPPLRYYVIAPIEAGAAAAAPGASVVVASVRLPQYLARAELVTRRGAHQLVPDADHRWGGDLGEDLTRVLARNLASLLASDAVVAAPHTLRTPAAFRVVTEIERFERVEGGPVELAARWWLLDGGEGRVLAQGRFARSEAAEGPAAADTVAAMSRAHAGLARVIAQALAQRAGSR